MIIGGLTEAWLGVAAERRSLESVARAALQPRLAKSLGGDG